MSGKNGVPGGGGIGPSGPAINLESNSRLSRSALANAAAPPIGEAAEAATVVGVLGAPVDAGVNGAGGVPRPKGDGNDDRTDDADGDGVPGSGLDHEGFSPAFDGAEEG